MPWSERRRNGPACASATMPGTLAAMTPAPMAQPCSRISRREAVMTLLLDTELALACVGTHSRLLLKIDSPQRGFIIKLDSTAPHALEGRAELVSRAPLPEGRL